MTVDYDIIVGRGEVMEVLEETGPLPSSGMETIVADEDALAYTSVP